MNETTLKMAAIRIGDTVSYVTEAGHRLTRQVAGWKDAHDGRERLLLLDNDTHIRVEQVLERQRPGGCCGAGVIVFDDSFSTLAAGNSQVEQSA